MDRFPNTALSFVAPMTFAVLLGLTIPNLVFGRAVFAATAGLALVALLISPLRAASWGALVRQARSPLGLVIGVIIQSMTQAKSSLEKDQELRKTIKNIDFIVKKVRARKFEEMLDTNDSKV